MESLSGLHFRFVLFALLCLLIAVQESRAQPAAPPSSIPSYRFQGSVLEVLGTDPASSTEVAWRATLPGSVTVHLVDGSALFIAVDTGELIFIDLTKPLPPQQPPQVILQKYVKQLVRRGSQISVHTVDYRIYYIDVSNPSEPRLLPTEHHAESPSKWTVAPHGTLATAGPGEAVHPSPSSTLPSRPLAMAVSGGILLASGLVLALVGATVCPRQEGERPGLCAIGVGIPAGIGLIVGTPLFGVGLSRLLR